MNTENNIQAGQDGSTLAGVASSPAGTVGNVETKGGDLSLTELNTFLGKNYPDKATALKSLKDTFSYVGKKVEAASVQTPAASPDTSEFTRQIKEMKEQLFYSENPQYKTPEMKGMISKMGENPADVVATPEFKAIFDKVSGYDKIQKTKTVLESNPRIGQVRNKISEAKTALNTGAGDYTKAKDLAVGAVLEALAE